MSDVISTRKMASRNTRRSQVFLGNFPVLLPVLFLAPYCNVKRMMSAVFLYCWTKRSSSTQPWVGCVLSIINLAWNCTLYNRPGWLFHWNFQDPFLHLFSSTGSRLVGVVGDIRDSFRTSPERGPEVTRNFATTGTKPNRSWLVKDFRRLEDLHGIHLSHCWDLEGLNPSYYQNETNAFCEFSYSTWKGSSQLKVGPFFFWQITEQFFFSFIASYQPHTLE